MSISEKLQPTGKALTPEDIVQAAIVKLTADAGAIFELDVMHAIRQLYATDKPAFARCRSAIKNNAKYACLTLTISSKFLSKKSLMCLKCLRNKGHGMMP